MPRVYTRKFDYEEAQRLYAGGALIESLAKKYGVSESRVWQVVTPGELTRRAAYSAARRVAWCEVCGAEVNRFSKKARHKRRLCRVCAVEQGKRDRAALQVRDTALLCVRCKSWKPDDAFPLRGSVLRRGRKSLCRECATKDRREFRKRFSERERATNRAWRASRRGKTTDV